MCNGCLLSRNAFAPLSSLKRARSTPHKTCGTECQELKSSLFTLSSVEEVIGNPVQLVRIGRNNCSQGYVTKGMRPCEEHNAGQYNPLVLRRVVLIDRAEPALAIMAAHHIYS